MVLKTQEQINKDKAEFVTVENRFWRQVIVSRYQYEKMLKNGDVKTPDRVAELEKQVEELKVVKRLEWEFLWEKVTDEPNEELILLENKVIEVTNLLEKQVEEKTALVEKVSALEKQVEELKAKIKK